MTLEVRSVTKRFGDLVANDAVDLVVEPGALHAVLGENGAGKSTLMKVLSGFQPADSGEVLLDGSRLELGSAKAAVVAGVGMLHQDPLVVLPFTALENFLFGRSLSRGGARSQLEEIAGRLGFDLDPDRRTSSLSVGERQQLEIVRLLSLGVRVLILDEPTSGISTGQREALFGALRSLAREGLIVLFVSHKLEEVVDLCTSVTVLRSGRVVGARALPCPTHELVELMFGKDLAPPVTSTAVIGGEILRVTGVEAHEGRQRIAVPQLSVAEGEVVGLAGLEGSGQRVLLRLLAGLLRPDRGEIRLGGVDVTRWSPGQLRRSGVHYLAAGRLEEGLFSGLSVAEHIELALPSGSRSLDAGVLATRASAAIDRFRIKATPASEIGDLSGGNQQRVLLAMVPENVRVLLMEHPTRGLDLESAEIIWDRLLEHRSDGTALVFASADLDELVRHSDRIAVCFDGRIVAVVDAGELDAERLGSLIGGVVE